MRYVFHTTDVFTDRLFGGNPLAVFPEAAGLRDVQMQRLAREFNLSETVFVLPPEHPAHACRLRIFTPKTELPFAGHPTVGTACLLAALGRLPLDSDVIVEETAGPVRVRVRSDRGKVGPAWFTTPQTPTFGPPPPAPADLAAVLGLAPEDLTGEPPQGVSCGLPWLIVPVRDRAAIGRARPDMQRWPAVLGGYWARGVYLVTRDTPDTNSALHARMFAPAIASHEDPATGSAAAALAGYLAPRTAATGTLHWRISQGHEMGRPSLIEIEADKDGEAIRAVRVGGRAVPVSEGTIEAGDDD